MLYSGKNEAAKEMGVMRVCIPNARAKKQLLLIQSRRRTWLLST
jgi:hypothetical protein